jgi:hypothetical protein
MSIDSVFKSTLVDASSRQPELTIGSAQAHALTWTLVNTATEPGKDLVVTPFGSGNVVSQRHHFDFSFSPGTLTAEPKLTGWDVAVKKDRHGGITNLYIALSGNAPLKIAPDHNLPTTLAYTSAIQEDRNDSNVAVKVAAGDNVTVGGQSIKDRIFGPFNLKLVPAGATRSAPPISIEFVGRRTVLNDGLTANEVSFALTNMMDGALDLTPEGGGTDTHPARFTVWFDPALAKAQDLDQVVLKPPGNSTDWTIAAPEPKADAPNEASPHRQWIITVAKVLSLKPQDPVVFKFTGTKRTGIVTDRAPGITRMYLRYEGLPGFSAGVLIAELEKSPVSYGADFGQGVYISAGRPQGATPPTVTYESGLHVRQFAASRPAATFEGGTVVTGSLSVSNQLYVRQGAYLDLLKITDQAGNQYKDCWIGMFENAGKKTLHIGGITDTDNRRRMMLAANSTIIRGDVQIDSATVTGSFTAKHITASIGAEITGGSLVANHDAWIFGGAYLYDLRMIDHAGRYYEGGRIIGIEYGGKKCMSISGIKDTDGKSRIITNADSTVISGEAYLYDLRMIDHAGKHYEGGRIIGIEYGGKKCMSISGIKDTDGKSRIITNADSTVISGDVQITGRLWAMAQTEKGMHGLEESWDDPLQLVARTMLAAAWKPTEFPSDLRLKTEVQSLPSALDKVRRMRGVTYCWNADALRHFTRNIESTFCAGLHATEAENKKVWQAERDKRHKELADINVGVIAQDVEAVLPEAVSTDEYGYKSVRYHHLTALLIEAVKEMDRTIKDQARRLAELEAVVARHTANEPAPSTRCRDSDLVEAGLGTAPGSSPTNGSRAR